MKFLNGNVYAAFISESFLILGRVLNFSDSGLEIQTACDDDIPLASHQKLDVFGEDRVYLKKVPVRILADDKKIYDQSPDNVIVRNLKFSFV